MIYSAWHDLRLSRLMLGTVQFGLPYGIANRTGQPAYDTVLAILAAAREGGVNCLDTAAAYGTSEEVLGRALQELKISEEVVVVTKVRPLSDDEVASSAAAAQVIERSVGDSRRRLRMDCLPVVLFHRERDAVHLDALERLRDRGWLRHMGVSCDHRPGPVREFVSDRRVSAIQIPANLVDRRHKSGGVFAESAARGVATFVRSVLLQGLLVVLEPEVPEALREILPLRRRLARIAGDGGMDLPELAVRYMVSRPEVTCVLTGVETEHQLRANVAILERGRLPDDVLAAVDGCEEELREELITPSLWPARKD